MRSITRRLACLICLGWFWVAQVAGRTAYVAQAEGGANLSVQNLKVALNDPSVDTIVMSSNYSVGAEFEAYVGERPSLKITRNVTMIGLPRADLVVWDLEFSWAVTELCSSCTLTIINMTIKNERRGSGAAVDFFVGKPGSAIILHNAYRWRPACTSTELSIQLSKTFKRSPQFLGPNGSYQQIVSSLDVVHQGKPYPGSLYLEDFSTDVPLTYQESRGAQGGHALYQTNTVRLCDRTVSQDCLAVKSPDACINILIDEVQAAAAAAAAAGQKQSLSVIAVAVPVVVAVVVVAAALAGLLVWMHKRRARKQQYTSSLEQRPQQSGCKDGSGGAGDPHNRGGDIEGGSLRNSPTDAQAQALESTLQPLLDASCWQLTSKNTATLDGVVYDDKIQFGVLLGAGSFGKVYRGCWAGRDVAIKVIEHDTTTSAAVENEVNLMLSFKHPNIVRAFHFVTYTYAADKSTASSRGGGGGLGPQGQDSTQATSTAGHGGGCSSSSLLQYTAAHCTISPARANTIGPAVATPAKDSSGTGLCDPICSTSDSHIITVSNPAGLAATDAAQLQQQQQLLLGSWTITSSGRTDPRNQPAASEVASNSRGPASQWQLQQDQDGHRGSCDRTDQQLQHNARWTAPHAATVAGMLPFPPSPAAAAAATASPVLSSATEAAAEAWGSDNRRIGSSDQGIDRSHWPGIISSRLSATAVADSLRPCAGRVQTYLVLEYCDCATLSEQASKWTRETEDDRQMLHRLLLLRDVARGLAALHAKCVVHADLNARNVLVSSSRHSECGMIAKLADLGLSRVIKQHSSHRTTNTVGTLSHQPPELLRYGRMSAAADVYAFGVMMWELFMNQMAFRKLHYGQFFDVVVLRNQRPPVDPDAGMPEDYQLLMEACWSTLAADRPNVGRILECLELMIQDRRQICSSSDWTTAAGAAAAGPATQPVFKREAGGLGKPPAAAAAAGSWDLPRQHRHSWQLSVGSGSTCGPLAGATGSSKASDSTGGTCTSVHCGSAHATPLSAQPDALGIVAVTRQAVVTQNIVFNPPRRQRSHSTLLPAQYQHPQYQQCRLEPSEFIESFD